MLTIINDRASKRTEEQGLLALLHISSSALPVGAFAYSQGLEYAIDSGWCSNREDIQAWLSDGLRFALGRLDLPIYLRMYEAWQLEQKEKLNEWNNTLLAYRETRELYLEDVQVGEAYTQWHMGLDKSRKKYIEWCERPTVVAMNSLASVLNSIPADKALLGFAWSWCENQIACASKSLPMGQTDGQRILQALATEIIDACRHAVSIKDEEIGSGLFAGAMASAWHEHQYSRLFRS